jgi:prevent-host-death family protein
MLDVEQIPIRVLNQDTASVLARVERGEVVEITNRGRRIARIVPVEPSELDDLVARGRIIPATGKDMLPMPTGPVDTAIDSADIVSELRDERL